MLRSGMWGRWRHWRRTRTSLSPRVRRRFLPTCAAVTSVEACCCGVVPACGRGWTNLCGRKISVARYVLSGRCADHEDHVPPPYGRTAETTPEKE